MNSWAIKIGGSLFTSSELMKWLDAIANYSDKNIVIIPGGGPFADQVRAADKKFNLDPHKAHMMAILAMQQYGTMLTSMCPSMQLASNVGNIRLAWEDNKVAVWEPFDMVSNECALKASWEHTSDSIAAWFSSYMQIDNLVLVKSTDIVINNKDIKMLVEFGCVDKELPKLLNEYNIDLHVMHKSQIKKFEDLMKQ